MPNFTAIKNYSDFTVLTQAQLDQAFGSIETFLNNTKLDSDNIQTGGIEASNLAASSVDSGALAANAVLLSKLATEVINKLVPTGVILAYAGTAAPSGYLLCDGSAVSRTAFASLYSVIGISHGQGDGSTTFNVPDMRGRFIRGRDAGAGRDPDASSRTAIQLGGNTGDTIGSLQGYATALPTTNFTTDTAPDHTHGVPSNDGTTSANAAGNLYTRQNTAGTSAPGGSHDHEVTGGGDDETRPVNVNENFIIKI